jgi:hypothetical protein
MCILYCILYVYMCDMMKLRSFGNSTSSSSKIKLEANSLIIAKINYDSFINYINLSWSEQK